MSKKKAAAKGKNGGPIASSKNELARWLRVSGGTVSNWQADGMPIRSDGTYDVLDIARWRIHWMMKVQKQPKPRSTNEEAYRKAKAEIEEIKLSKLRGELVSRQDVDTANVAKVLAVKRALLALPKQVAPSLAGREPREIQARLTTRLEEAIARFADGKLEPRPKVKKRGRPRKKNGKK